jgi:hypothetical protein
MWPFHRKKNDRPPEQKTPHHYVLAHIALRQVAVGNPYGFFAVMASPKQQEFLDDLWRQVCQNCDKNGPACFTSSDLSVHTTQIGNYPTVLVEMPKPHFIGEAHMICIVLKVPIQQLPARPDDPEVQYFALEKGRRVTTGEDRTVLCAWDGETHVNYGDGPEANPAAFLGRVGDLI